MKLKHLSLSFSVFGVLSLYLLSMLSQPSEISIAELPKYEGKLVTVEGLVTSYYITKYGSQLITIKENNATTTLFLEESTEVEYGDKIRATGEVQKFKDDWEIIVENVRDIELIRKWSNISFPLWQLAENPTKYLGLNVNVTGYIESISNGYFNLVDLEEKHSLIVFYNLSRNITLYPGQKVSVSGKFSFGSENFRYKLVLFDDNHCITFLRSNE
jgi:hypothetical protein